MAALNAGSALEVPTAEHGCRRRRAERDAGGLFWDRIGQGFIVL
jgi:hypothetical protein